MCFLEWNALQGGVLGYNKGKSSFWETLEMHVVKMGTAIGGFHCVQIFEWLSCNLPSPPQNLVTHPPALDLPAYKPHIQQFSDP